MNEVMEKEELSAIDNIAEESENPKASENSHLLARAMKIPLTKCMNMLGTRNICVDFLAIMFGIGSWIGINSMYLQLPLLVEVAPEGWSLPSYLVIVIQIGNIGPLAYTVYQKYSARKIKDAYMIYGIYVIGIAATLCMAFLHQITAFVAGQQRSVALLSITFFCAFIGCTSSVLFMPYMGRFQEIYLVTYLVGEGLSGFLPSILALIQGVGGNPECIPNDSPGGPAFTTYSEPPRFNTRVFFLFVFVLMSMSAVGFILLHKLKMCKREYAKVTIRDGNDYNYMPDDEKKHESPAGNARPTDGKVIDGKIEEAKEISPMNYLYLMMVMGVVSMFGSGVFPGLQSYSCLPYGNLAYHLTVTLSSIANPLACFLAVFLPHKSIRHISVLMIIMFMITCYALATAVLSPSPPLIGTTIGETLVVTSWMLLTGLVSYIKLAVTTIFRYQGGKSLVWIGAVSQIGSAIGSVITFALVNFTNIFQTFQPC